MSALDNFKRWTYVMQQVNEATYYCERATEVGHPHLFTTIENLLEFFGAFRESINSYSKCFVSAGPGRVKLDANKVFESNDKLRKKHETIIELRNKYVSHSDSNEMESVEIEFTETENEILINNHYNISFPFDRLYDLTDVVKHVNEYVADRLEAHMNAIQKETGKHARLLRGGE